MLVNALLLRMAQGEVLLHLRGGDGASRRRGLAHPRAVEKERVVVRKTFISIYGRTRHVNGGLIPGRGRCHHGLTNSAQHSVVVTLIYAEGVRGVVVTGACDGLGLIFRSGHTTH